VKQAEKTTILAARIAFMSIWIVSAAGITAFWVLEELRMFGLVLLPVAIVASLLVFYFNWRAKLRRRILAECDNGQNRTEAA
jgi:hypothetical protein